MRKDVIECQSLEDSDEKIDTSPPRKHKLIKEMSFQEKKSPLIIVNQTNDDECQKKSASDLA